MRRHFAPRHSFSRTSHRSYSWRTVSIADRPYSAMASQTSTMTPMPTTTPMMAFMTSSERFLCVCVEIFGLLSHARVLPSPCPGLARPDLRVFVMSCLCSVSFAVGGNAPLTRHLESVDSGAHVLSHHFSSALMRFEGVSSLPPVWLSLRLMCARSFALPLCAAVGRSAAAPLSESCASVDASFRGPFYERVSSAFLYIEEGCCLSLSGARLSSFLFSCRFWWFKGRWGCGIGGFRGCGLVLRTSRGLFFSCVFSADEHWSGVCLSRCILIICQP